MSDCNKEIFLLATKTNIYSKQQFQISSWCRKLNFVAKTVQSNRVTLRQTQMLDLQNSLISASKNFLTLLRYLCALCSTYQEEKMTDFPVLSSWKPVLKTMIFEKYQLQLIICVNN